MTENFSLFLKLLITQKVLRAIDQSRRQLQSGLVELAADPVLLKRRFRMLRQLALYEAQIIDKIYNFDFENVNEYYHAHNLIFEEIQCVSSKNA